MNARQMAGYLSQAELAGTKPPVMCATLTHFPPNTPRYMNARQMAGYLAQVELDDHKNPNRERMRFTSWARAEHRCGGPHFACRDALVRAACLLLLDQSEGACDHSAACAWHGTHPHICLSRVKPARWAHGYDEFNKHLEGTHTLLVHSRMRTQTTQT